MLKIELDENIHCFKCISYCKIRKHYVELYMKLKLNFDVSDKQFLIDLTTLIANNCKDYIGNLTGSKMKQLKELERKC